MQEFPFWSTTKHVQMKVKPHQCGLYFQTGSVYKSGTRSYFFQFNSNDLSESMSRYGRGFVPECTCPHPRATAWSLFRDYIEWTDLCLMKRPSAEFLELLLLLGCILFKLVFLYGLNKEIHFFFMWIFHLLAKHLEWGEIFAVCRTGRLNCVLQHVHSGTGKQSFNIYHEYNIRGVCLKKPLKCETGVSAGPGRVGLTFMSCANQRWYILLHIRIMTHRGSYTCSWWKARAKGSNFGYTKAQGVSILNILVKKHAACCYICVCCENDF